MSERIPFGTPRPHRFALFGTPPSGRWAEEAMRFACFHAMAGDGSIAIVQTGTSADGEDPTRLAERAQRMGLVARVVPIHARGHAHDPALIAQLERASVVHLSDGSLPQLVRTLAGSPVMDALLTALDRGAVVAGDGAGARALGCYAAYGTGEGGWGPGLALLPDTVVVPGCRGASIPQRDGHQWVASIAERTALICDGERWRVFGEGSVELRLGDRAARIDAPSAFTSTDVAERLSTVVTLGERSAQPTLLPVATAEPLEAGAPLEPETEQAVEQPQLKIIARREPAALLGSATTVIDVTDADPDVVTAS